MLLSKLWLTLFPKKNYSVYVDAYRVYHGNNKREAMACYDRQCSNVRSWREGGNVALVRRTISSTNTSEVLKHCKIRSSRENDTFNCHIPFTSGN